MWTRPDGALSKPGMVVQGTVVPVEDYYTTIGGQQVASEYVYDATKLPSFRAVDQLHPCATCSTAPSRV